MSNIISSDCKMYSICVCVCVGGGGGEGQRLLGVVGLKNDALLDSFHCILFLFSYSFFH